ncbi:hypothetical protein ABIS04_13310 [Shewanella sp. H8]|uniref:hypothetical protein n=1 Tax=Shewanella sp. H8 TaxID=3342676 RepID=UPI003314B0CA
MMNNYKASFLQHLQQVRDTAEATYLDKDYDEKVKFIFFNDQMTYSLGQSLLSFSLAKTLDESIDIRHPFSHMGQSSSYSARVIDENAIVPSLIENGFQKFSRSCFINQSMRRFPEISSSYYQTGKITNLMVKFIKPYETLLDLLYDVELGVISSKNLLNSALKHYIELNRINSKSYKLKESLLTCRPGKLDAYEFEKVGESIISYVFDGKLKLPARQSSTRDKKQRRDGVFRITSEEGFWGRVQRKFNSDFIIVDYKNYGSNIESDTLYSVSKYANNAIGKFIIIVSRLGISNKAIDSQLRVYRDMGVVVIVLSDDDLNMLIDNKNNEQSDECPSQLLDSKLDELLLGY